MRLMAKRVDFTVSKKPGVSLDERSVFTTLSGSGHIVRVMNADSYAKATKRADRSLAASMLAQRLLGSK